MQKYKHLIWVLIISIVVIVVVLWAVHTPANQHQLNKESKKYLPRPANQEKGNDQHIHENPSHSAHAQSTTHPGTLKLKPHHYVQSSTQNRPPQVTSQHYKRTHKLANTAGYIITQTYGGQMTRAIRNLMLQQCWADTLVTASNHSQSLYIVEPFSERSNLLHKPAMWEALDDPDATSSTPRFSDYYDLNFYNQYSIHNHSVPLALWEDFLANAPRYVVVVVTPTTNCAQQLTSDHNQNRRNNEAQLLQTSCTWMKPFRVFVDGLAKWGFSVKRTVCVTCDRLSHPIALQDLYNQIYQGQNISEITVFINSWRNFKFTAGWLQVPNYCQMGEDPTSSKRLIPSKSVVKNTQYYKKYILKSDKVIAVMLRIERFLTLKETGRSNETVESCLDKTIALRNKLRDQLLSNSGTFLTLDVGRFGSRIMQSRGQESIRKAVEKTVNDLYNNQYTIKSWEDTFVEASGGIEERGYIAMLQRNIATESDCLILMGGGSFQQVAAFQYIKNHPDPSTRCLHTVCVADSFVKSINS